MRILVDGVFFQLASSGIARVWQSVLPRLASKRTIEVIILDRGRTPAIPSATLIPFPAYKDRYTADDSLLIQKLCDNYKIDIFISTYYTSPVSTPTIMLVYDMIPELLDFDSSQRFWMEKEITISFARRFITISRSTKKDLLRFYPEISEDVVTVAHPGYDNTIFYPHPKDDIRRFCETIGFDRPYVLLVGSREQHKGYKNGRLLFQALSQMTDVRFDVLCVGGEPEINPESIALIPSGCRVQRLSLSDDELALAYGGARALIYPSLYEGFGLPVVEAMASGCPVITTTNGSLAEIVHGDVCLTIDATSVAEMVDMLLAVRRPATRKRLIAAGLKRAQSFSWDTLVNTIEQEVINLAREAGTGAFVKFFGEWRQLRMIQADVDAQKIF